MKMILKGIDQVFDCSTGKVCSVIIENQNMFLDIITDINHQIEGNEGVSVLSENNIVLKMSKYAEQLAQFVPFDLNKKALLNKIMLCMQKIAADEDHLAQVNEVLAAWEKLCIDIEFEIPINVEFTKINIETLIKAAGVMIKDDYDCLTEKLLDYMQLVETFENEKLFIFVNLRSFINDNEMQRFVDSVVMRGYRILLLDGGEHKVLNHEKRYVIDEEMCEICYD